MDAKLIIVKGKANKDCVSLKLPTVIGRSREADLTVAHPMVSRRHCELFEVDGLVRVRDLGSSNGTFLGNQQIQEAALYPNAEFSIGPLTFRIEYEYAGPIAQAPVGAPVGSVQSPGGAVAGGVPAAEALAETPPFLAPAAGGPSPGVFAPDAGVPDFSAFSAAVESGQATPRQAAEPIPPDRPPVSSERVAAELPSAQTLGADEEPTGARPVPPETIAWVPADSADSGGASEAIPFQPAPEVPAEPVDAGPEPSAAEEPEEPAAEEPAEEPAKARRRWWPFGRRKKEVQKEKAAQKDSAKESPAGAGTSPAREPATPAGALAASPPSPSEEAVADFLNALDGAEQQPAGSPADSDALSQFLKGLK